jgi:L,D-transpeptidase ErfK/SrfK
VLLLPTRRVAPEAGADGLVINLPERSIYVYQENRPVRVFAIAVGRPGRWETPAGDFHVANKRKNPTWFPPEWAGEEAPVPPGPHNPLGDRWMGLSAPGIGIHATNAPSSVGRSASHGCMRMYPEGAHALYNLVKVGTSVKIIYRLAVIGYDSGDGVVYLAHYPNPYRRRELTVDDVLKQLARVGLAEVADVAAIGRELGRARGLPTPIVGSKTRVVVSGRPMRSVLGPTRLDGDWLVPVEPLAEALGAYADISPNDGSVVVARGEQRVMFLPDQSEALVNGEPHPLSAPMKLAAGYPLVPLWAMATALGASVGWDNETKTILVWDSPQLGDR